jgi:hypothetical protein
MSYNITPVWTFSLQVVIHIHTNMYSIKTYRQPKLQTQRSRISLREPIIGFNSLLMSFVSVYSNKIYCASAKHRYLKDLSDLSNIFQQICCIVWLYLLIPIMNVFGSEQIDKVGALVSTDLSDFPNAVIANEKLSNSNYESVCCTSYKCCCQKT